METIKIKLDKNPNYNYAKERLLARDKDGGYPQTEDEKAKENCEDENKKGREANG